jgi:hypothetical protein
VHRQELYRTEAEAAFVAKLHKLQNYEIASLAD